jgi:hypothetical protein
MRTNSIEKAEAAIREAEAHLEEAKRKLFEVKGESEPIRYFKNLVKEHGFDIDGEVPGKSEFLPRIKGDCLLIKFPNANSDWTFAIFNACMEYCKNRGGYPEWGGERDRDELKISCAIKERE